MRTMGIIATYRLQRTGMCLCIGVWFLMAAALLWSGRGLLRVVDTKSCSAFLESAHLHVGWTRHPGRMLLPTATRLPGYFSLQLGLPSYCLEYPLTLYFDIPGWMILAPSACIIAVLWHRHIRAGAHVQRIRTGLCPVCGYDLRNNVSGRCPECGWLINWLEPIPSIWGLRSSRRAIALLYGAVFLATPCLWSLPYLFVGKWSSLPVIETAAIHLMGPLWLPVGLSMGLSPHSHVAEVACTAVATWTLMMLLQAWGKSRPRHLWIHVGCVSVWWLGGLISLVVWMSIDPNGL